MKVIRNLLREILFIYPFRTSLLENYGLLDKPVKIITAIMLLLPVSYA